MGSRAFAEGDLSRILELCQERWPEVRHSFGEIAYWAVQLAYNDWEARLWLDGDRVVGWGWQSGGFLEFDGSDEVVKEIVAWAAPEHVATRPADAVWLEPLGFRCDESAPWFRLNRRPLDDVESPRLPDGYRLTTMAEYDGFSSRAAAHRAAFDGSRLTDEVFAQVRASWPYCADLDCVCLAPDGSVASYALGWLDGVNGLGELEPVGTLPEHRRLGLARATNLFALRRLREEGAGVALVGSRGDAAYPLPSRLYESVGFREVARTVRFTRVSPPA